MPTLLLMRHAEAGPVPAGGGDHDRPLTPAGMADAAAVGGELARRGLTPAIALVSTAQRTRDTVEAVRGAMPGTIDVMLEPELYGADAETILAWIRAHADTEASALVVGHNPGIAALAAALARGAGGPAMRAFAPATVAAFAFEGVGWPSRGARLIAVITPRDAKGHG
ncbi:MAG: SixA phosphatase family protein [Alphaproteobacteria bacterium]